MDKKLYQDRRGFVIGGGESIKVLENKGLNLRKLLTDEITIGTNKSYRVGKSNYHVAMDLPYFDSDSKNLLKQNLYVSDIIFDNRQGRFPELKKIQRLSNTTKYCSDSFDEGLYYGKSTGYLAMNIANILGCNPIYLLGIDLVGYHFHEGYGNDKDKRLAKEHKVIEKEFRTGIRFLQERGINVISLSDTSKLNDIIPYDPSILKLYGWHACKDIEKTIGEYWGDSEIELKLRNAGLPDNHKYLDRMDWMERKVRLVHQLLPEYEYMIKNGSKSSKSVLDLSTGNGIFLEIMRYLGHNICGTDSPKCKYTAFHKSQEIPMLYFDGSVLPYPVKDQSYDLVSCVSAINFYKTDWRLILNEFFRIARQTVLLVVNRVTDRSEEMWLQYKPILDSYTPPPGWKLQYQFHSTYKWIREG